MTLLLSSYSDTGMSNERPLNVTHPNNRRYSPVLRHRSMLLHHQLDNHHANSKLALDRKKSSWLE